MITVRQEGAALALGESRLEGALARVIEVSEGCDPRDPRTKVFFSAIALQRTEPAYRYLLEKIANAPASAASVAAEALSIHSYNRELRDRVVDIARARRIKPLDDAVAAHWRE